MKNIYLVLIFFNVFHLTFGQSEVEMGIVGDFSQCNILDVKIDKRNNRILTGNYSNDSGEIRPLYINQVKYNLPSASGFFCIKLNEKKEVVWLKTIERKTASRYSFAYSVLDDSSNVYVIGKVQQVLQFDENTTLDSPTGDVFVAKYASDGKLKWAKKYVGSSDEASIRPKIDKDGNLYILGRYQKSLEVEGKQVLKAIGQNPEPYLLKLDRNGNCIWAKGFDEKLEVNLVTVNKNNNIFLSGNFTNSIILNDNIKLQSAGYKDIFYAKFDQNGQILWAKTIGSSQRDNSNAIEADDFGNIYLAGVVSNEAKFDTLQVSLKSELNENIFITKIESNKGKIEWVRNMTYGGTLFDVYQYGDAVRFLKLNNVGEPYFIGIVMDYLNIGEDIKFKGNYFRGIQYIVKYSTEGKLLYASDSPASVGDGLTIWNSMAFTSQNEILISSFKDGFTRRTTYTTSSLLKKVELNNNMCNNDIIPIERDNTNILNISKSVVYDKNFNYQWYKNGEAILNGTQASFQTKEPGYYSLKLINKTNSACEVSSSNSILVFQPVDNYPSVLSVSLFSPNTIVLNSMAPKTEWFLDGKLLVGVTGNYSYTYTADGTYKAKQYFENGIIKESNEVVIKDGLVLNVTKEVTYDDGDICKPMPNLIATINNQVFPNDDLKYQWYQNGLAVKDSTFKHFRAVTSGEYYAIVFVVSRNQAYSTGKYKIVVEDFPKSLPITKIEDICGAKALLKVDDSFIQRYGFQSIIWRVDDKVIAKATQPFYNANKGGYYTFSVQYKEPSTGKTCTYNSFTTFEKKNDFKLNLGYAYAGSGCMIDSFKVFTEQNARYSYTWTKNDIPIEKQTSSEIFIKDKARYKALVKRNDGCVNETDEISLKGCTSDESERFLLLNPPKITADKTSFFSDGKALLSFEGCSNVNIQWLKNDQVIAGANQENLEVKEGGNYALQIEKFGCKTTTNTIKISVETILAVGEENPNFNIEVYPNPVEERLFISIPAQINTPINVKMTDISGKLISDYDFSTSNNQFIDLKSFQTGMYYLVFEMQGKRVVKKIIKNN